MNKRQKKKAFKKKYGVNPPKGLSFSIAGKTAEVIKSNTDAWGRAVNTLIGLGRTMRKVYEKILEDQSQYNIRKLQCQKRKNRKKVKK